MNKKIENAVREGLDFLAREQQKDGSFLSFSSSRKNNFDNAKIYHSPFPATLILRSLDNVSGVAKVKLIKSRLAKFLLSQKSDYWSFNYWNRGSQESRKLSYPDDLDVSFCGLAGLFLYDHDLIDGEALAKIAILLTAAEEKEGGPYRTWLAAPEAEAVWKDVDLAVNCNIAHFLFLQKISLPKMNSFFEKAIKENNYHSPYYPNIYPVIYFMSLFYRGKNKNKIIDFLFQKQKNDKWENALNTALAISSLKNFGAPADKLKSGVSFILKSQRSGKWKPYAFCLDPAINRKKYYAGSSALTTAFCIEAISKFNVSAQKLKTKTAKQNLKIYKKVILLARKRFSALDFDLRNQALKFLSLIIKKDKNKEIVLLPYFFTVSLGEKKKNVSSELVASLCLANLYGWIAYTIYDDFLDDEGDPQKLSVANVCLRELTVILENILPKENRFHEFFLQIMDKVDSANAWELAHCRKKFLVENNEQRKIKIPDYKNPEKLAERSMGHALGPVAILFSLGYGKNSSEVKNLMKFFKHYLTAKQISDDAHDWEDDLKRGQINYAGALVLKKAGKDISDFSRLQKFFWNEVIDDVCRTGMEQINLARSCSSSSLLEKFLVPIENSFKEAIKEKIEAIKFLKEY